MVTPRPKAKKRRKTDYMKQADTAFSLLIRDRDGMCVRCLKQTDLQCAHVVSRSYHGTRCDFENAVTLCKGCHVYFTHRPLEWEQWMNENFGGRFDRMRMRALTHITLGAKIDWRETRDQLQELVRETIG
jgi:hypothetical protein